MENQKPESSGVGRPVTSNPKQQRRWNNNKTRGAGRGRHRTRQNDPHSGPLEMARGPRFFHPGENSGQPMYVSDGQAFDNVTNLVTVDSQTVQDRGREHQNDASRGHGSRQFRGRYQNRKEYQSSRHPEESNLDDQESQTKNQQSQRGIGSRRSRGRGGRQRSFLDFSRETGTPIVPSSSDNYQLEKNNSLDSCPRDPAENDNTESNVQSEISESQLKTNSFECMICCDNITRFHPIWYCDNCFNIFHLKCAIEWCNKSIKSRNEAIASSQYPSLGQAINVGGINHINHETTGFSDYQRERMKSVEWPCPACREVLHSRPNKYRCFCGKVIRPEVNRHLTPHSCGQLCGKKRPNPDCPHLCNNICHPGKCSSCPLTSKKTCFCGKVTRELKCSLGIVSCDQECSKPLSCGNHTCTRPCHDGSCGSCNEIIIVSCRCSKERQERKCEELSTASKKVYDEFSCDEVCSKMLECGKHYCTDKCHTKCRTCKLLSENIKTCPCGSTNIKKSLLAERKSCTDPVPTCQNKCNRVLPCGPEKNRHKCQKKCHSGPCPPCKLKTTAHCDCKLSTKTIECSMMYERIVEGDLVYFKQATFSFRCESRCNKPKSCGRHRCNNKCCDFGKTLNQQLHKCDQICNRKLLCGLHNCPEPCHPGQCGDCTNIGWTDLTCHCGGSVHYPPIPCGARPPVCHRPCRRAHSCGHPVKHECHDDLEKCAPCTEFVRKSCFCGSDSKDSVYCYLPGYSCGRTCKQQLNCRQHTCKRICHSGDCEVPNERGVILCNQTCPVSRYICKHPCGLPCHGKTPCPSSLCKRTIEVTCPCGNKTDRIECHKLSRDADNQIKVAMMSTNRTNQDTVMIDLSKKTSTSTENQTDSSRKQLDCDETCSIYKRNKALAEALEIAQPDLKPVTIFGEDPLRLVREATAYDYKFVSATFNSLSKLVNSARESDKRFIFMPFPPADKLRREVVHELAHHFNCTSESRDEDPFRHVVVRAYKNKSCVPDFTIEQLLPVSD